MLHSVADAETLCREGDIPSSKIYLALEKLNKLGLVDVQPTRPKLFSARSTNLIFSCLIELSRERADRFAAEAQRVKARFEALPAREEAGRTAFVDLALGHESPIRRHLMHLAAAHRRVWSYMEQRDIEAMDEAEELGVPLLRRMARNVSPQPVVRSCPNPPFVP